MQNVYIFWSLVFIFTKSETDYNASFIAIIKDLWVQSPISFRVENNNNFQPQWLLCFKIFIVDIKF